MTQTSFAPAEKQNREKEPRRARSLPQTAALMLWRRLDDALSPPWLRDSTGKLGCPPVRLERMLCVYLLQLCYALADEALEDAIYGYDSQMILDFVGIDLTNESGPDGTTLLCFYLLLEKHAACPDPTDLRGDHSSLGEQRKLETKQIKNADSGSLA